MRDDNSKGYIIYRYVRVCMRTVGMYRISNLILWRRGKKTLGGLQVATNKRGEIEEIFPLATFDLLSLFILQLAGPSGGWMLDARGDDWHCGKMHANQTLIYNIYTKPSVIFLSLSCPLGRSSRRAGKSCNEISRPPCFLFFLVHF